MDSEKPYTPCPTIPNSPNKDYSKINEYVNYDPYHRATIKYLVDMELSEPQGAYVIYLDDKLDVCWCTTNRARKASPGMRAVRKRLIFLESMPISHLGEGRREEFRKLLGEGLSHFLSCNERPVELRNAEATALATFDEAERRINQWNFEYTTQWYTVASMAMLVAAIVLIIAASTARSSPVTWDLAQFGFAGALGALLFFLVRLRNSAPGQLRVEVSGSRLSYFTTTGAKVLVGMVSAVAIGAAMRADLLLGVAYKTELVSMPEPFTISAVAFVACFVAGFSESLVPRFLTSFERSSGPSEDAPGAPAAKEPLSHQPDD
jgi:hypothetical protein